jgi:hypothetical protein
MADFFIWRYVHMRKINEFQKKRRKNQHSKEKKRKINNRLEHDLEQVFVMEKNTRYKSGLPELYIHMYTPRQFLLNEAQPKNALVTPAPQIRKPMQTFKREHSMLKFYIQYYSAGVQFYISLQYYNFQASLNHRANACSCLFFL